MKLEPSKKYTVDNCALVIEIISIFYESEFYYKVKYKLTSKTGLFFEIKSKKLEKELIKNWRVVK